MENQRILQESTTRIIQELQEIRDAWIAKLLQEDELNSFLEEQYSVVALSAIKTEFLKCDLRELHATPLDLVHYSALIREVKEKGASAQGSHLFLSELEKLFEKYIVK